ncbi:hypothetical protein BDZ91DRAFT_795775 [Kalaharituber pfeilii]|nr:hypothetical protein BDZ91DRAFT_795775 [Kalaharituber pfeilii]
MSQANVEKIPAPIALPIKPCTHNALRQQVSHSVRQGKGPSIPATASHRDRLGVSTRTRRVPGAFAEPIYSPSKIPLRILGAKLGSPSTYKWNPTKSCTSVRASLSKIPMPMKGHASNSYGGLSTIFSSTIGQVVDSPVKLNSTYGIRILSLRIPPPTPGSVVNIPDSTSPISPTMRSQNNPTRLGVWRDMDRWNREATKSQIAPSKTRNLLANVTTNHRSALSPKAAIVSAGGYPRKGGPKVSPQRARKTSWASPINKSDAGTTNKPPLRPLGKENGLR